MTRYCIALTDGARARFFNLDSEEPKLVEVGDLVNLEHQMTGAQLFGSSKSGEHFRHDGHPNSVDDHRNAHDAELNRRFAKRIFEELGNRAAQSEARCLRFVGTPKMVGVMAEHLAHLEKQGFEVKAQTKELSKLSAAEIHDHLAASGFVPAPRRLRS